MCDSEKLYARKDTRPRGPVYMTHSARQFTGNDSAWVGVGVGGKATGWWKHGASGLRGQLHGQVRVLNLTEMNTPDK